MADYIYYVTVSGSAFLIDGEPQAELGLKAGLTYRFDVSDASCASQTFKFSTTSDGTHGGGSEYTTNVTVTGTAGSSGAVVDLVVPSSTGTLYYYNGSASGYGGTIRYTTDTYVSTTNLGLKVPLPGASDDVWASHLNASLRTIDSVVEGKAPLNSPTFTGTISGGTLGSGVVFPAGHIIQFAQSFTETGGGVIGNLSSVGSGSPATILTATINNVLASSKVFGFFYSGYMVLNSSQYIANNITGGSINTDYFNQAYVNARYSPTFFFYDNAPGTGTNSYVLTGYSSAAGNAAYWCSSGGYAYGWMLFEIAQ